ncbi:MAG TPA: hypothetical protein VNX40_15865 [Mucilaginibacter sp.]|nr:hypothetical protein [Mucilaginibacter sp.]
MASTPTTTQKNQLICVLVVNKEVARQITIKFARIRSVDSGVLLCLGRRLNSSSGIIT